MLSSTRKENAKACSVSYITFDLGQQYRLDPKNASHILPSLLPQLAEMWFPKYVCVGVFVRGSLDGKETCILRLLCGRDEL